VLIRRPAKIGGFPAGGGRPGWLGWSHSRTEPFGRRKAGAAGEMKLATARALAALVGPDEPTAFPVAASSVENPDLAGAAAVSDRAVPGSPHWRVEPGPDAGPPRLRGALAAVDGR
jgi:hypothetical protein